MKNEISKNDHNRRKRNADNFIICYNCVRMVFKWKRLSKSSEKTKHTRAHTHTPFHIASKIL